MPRHTSTRSPVLRKWNISVLLHRTTVAQQRQPRLKTFGILGKYRNACLIYRRIRTLDLRYLQLEQAIAIRRRFAGRAPFETWVDWPSSGSASAISS